MRIQSILLFIYHYRLNTMKPLLSILLLAPLVTTSHAKVVGPLCQWVNDPSKSLSIHWIETSQPSVESKGNFTLKYRRAKNDPWQDTRVISRSFSDTRDHVYSVELSNLIPDRRYFFQIIKSGIVIGSWHFKTAPLEVKQGVTFVTGGDMFHTRELLDPMNMRAGTEDPLFALLGGDLAYANGIDKQKWIEWVDSWNKYARSTAGDLIPMIAVIGNHEVRGASYRPSNAPPPSEAPFFYSLFHGLNDRSNHVVKFEDYLTIITLDSGHTQNVSEQVDWLDKTLKEASPKAATFVCYHRPAYGTGVKENAVDIQRLWSPLFEKYSVLAAFENDHHVYKRTHPLTKGKRDDRKGVVYLGDGAWGTRTRQIAPDWKLQRPYLAHAEATNHLIKVTVTSNQISYEAIKADGTTIDSYKKERSD